jgi:hypothetical protein
LAAPDRSSRTAAPRRRSCVLTKNVFTIDLPKVMPALGLGEEPIPLWWTSGFVLASPVGTAAADEKWIVGEFS